MQPWMLFFCTIVICFLDVYIDEVPGCSIPRKFWLNSRQLDHQSAVLIRGVFGGNWGKLMSRTTKECWVLFRRDHAERMFEQGFCFVERRRKKFILVGCVCIGLVDFGADSANFALWACKDSDVTHFHDRLSEAAIEVGRLPRKRRHQCRRCGVLSQLLVDLHYAMVLLQLLVVAGVEDELCALV